MLLDTEGQGSGFYLPELHEPEHCNAHNTSLFELHLLKVSTYLFILPALTFSIFLFSFVFDSCIILRTCNKRVLLYSQKHYHPAVQKYSQHVLASCPSQGHHQLPAEVARK